MWIMTPFGILMPSTIPDEVRTKMIAAEGDETWNMQVRVRDRRALTYLRKTYMRSTLGPTIATPQMDYDYRAYCAAGDFAEAVSRMIVEIDYEKFKPETYRFKWGEDLHKLYNRIWSVVFAHYDRPVKQAKTNIRWWEDK